MWFEGYLVHFLVIHDDNVLTCFCQGYQADRQRARTSCPTAMSVSLYINSKVKGNRSVVNFVNWEFCLSEARGRFFFKGLVAEAELSNHQGAKLSGQGPRIVSAERPNCRGRVVWRPPNFVWEPFSIYLRCKPGGVSFSIYHSIRLKFQSARPVVSNNSILKTSYRPFWDNCTEWLQNDIKHWKVKGTSYAYYNYLTPNPKFHPLSLYGKKFSLTKKK